MRTLFLMFVLINLCLFAQEPSQQSRISDIIKNSMQDQNIVKESPPQSESLSLHRHIIYDSHFGMEAGRCLIPKDWEFSAEIVWDWYKQPPTAFPVIFIANPEGSLVFQVLPRLQYFYSTDAMVNLAFSTNYNYEIMELTPIPNLFDDVIAPNFLDYLDGFTIEEYEGWMKQRQNF